MPFIIGRGFLLSYRQVAAAQETGMFAEKHPKRAPSNSRACRSDRREDALFPGLPRLVFPGLRGELNGNRLMGDRLGRVRRKLDDELASPVGTFGKLATGDRGNL